MPRPQRRPTSRNQSGRTYRPPTTERRYAPEPRHTPEPHYTPPPSDDGEPAERPASAPRRPVPEGVPVVRLRSAGFGTFFYDKMIDRVDGRPEDGDLVAVADKYDELFGWGFFNGSSQLVLRMLTHDQRKPDDTELINRVVVAVRLRRDMLNLEATTDAYRLVHAEGDGLTGLIADRFENYVVIELFSLAMHRRLHMLQDAFITAGLDVRDFVVRADKEVQRREGFHLDERHTGPKDLSTVITENGVKFQVDLGRGHKTGFFCDQRDNRLALAGWTAGKSVLDVCCYTGGFACYAAVKGAASDVTAIDLDEKALEVAKVNASLNKSAVKFHHCDAFDYLRQAMNDGKQWDVVVVDPSKFVARRSDMELGLRKYMDLNRLAISAVRPGGLLLTCSCSGLVDSPTFIKALARSARSANRALQMLRVNGAGADHPIMADTPESGYLKVVWARVR